MALAEPLNDEVPGVSASVVEPGPKATTPPPRPAVAPDGAFSLLLDACRGLAALAVVLGHARSIFLVDFPALAAPTPLDQGVYFLAFGHQAVIVFFVLSGWLVGGTTLVQQWRGTFSARSYALQRISRIYLVLVPAMLLGLIAHAVYLALDTPPPAPGEPGAMFDQMLSDSTETLYGLLTFLGNLIGLNTIVVPNYGGNEVLWSLSHEIVFYALVPLWGTALVALLKDRARVWPTLVRLGLVTAVIVLLPGYHRFTLLLWTLGALAGARLAFTARPWRVGRAHKLASWAPFAAMLVLTRLGILPPLWGDLALALTFLFILALHRAATPIAPSASSAPASARPEGLVARLFRGLAALSFSLYVLHPLVLIAVATATLGGRRLPADARGYALLLLAMAVSLSLAWGFSKLTEARTNQVRRWLAHRLGQ